MIRFEKYENCYDLCFVSLGSRDLLIFSLISIEGEKLSFGLSLSMDAEVPLHIGVSFGGVSVMMQLFSKKLPTFYKEED